MIFSPVASSNAFIFKEGITKEREQEMVLLVSKRKVTGSLAVA